MLGKASYLISPPPTRLINSIIHEHSCKILYQINKSYEFFIMDQSSSYIIRTYSYTETNMHLIYKNAFKRCINTCTFHDNLLFYICSVDGLNQILDFFFFFFAFTFSFIFTNTMKDTINGTEFWNNSLMCLAMSHHPYISGFAAA